MQSRSLYTYKWRLMGKIRECDANLEYFSHHPGCCRPDFLTETVEVFQIRLAHADRFVLRNLLIM